MVPWLHLDVQDITNGKGDEQREKQIQQTNKEYIDVKLDDLEVGRSYFSPCLCDSVSVCLCVSVTL